MQHDAIRSIEHIIAQRRDAALVKSALAGDNASFAKLVGLYKKRVTALGMSFFKYEHPFRTFHVFKDRNVAAVFSHAKFI